MTERFDGGQKAEALIEQARALIPVLRERAGAQTAERSINRDTLHDLGKAGFFRVLQPKRWQGFEMDPRVFAQIQIALAQGDMSTAWVYGVIGVHPFQLALFDDRAAKDVWSDSPDVLIASTYMPTGRAKPVSGGFEFSGRWKFSSGSEHCDWVFLGGLVGDPAQGDYRTFMLPKSDFRIEDTWHVLGLKGTGSQDIVVETVFVPDYRVHNLADAYRGQNPGNAVNTGWLYTLPFPLVFGRAVSTGCIGALQALLDAFCEYGGKRINTTGSSTARDPDAQLAAAEAKAGIEEMTATLQRNYAAMVGYAKAGQQTPTDEKLLYKYQSAAVADRCLDLAGKLFRCVGGSGLFETLPFSRLYADLITARQHVSNQSQVWGRNLGGTLMGLENADRQI